MTRQPTPRRGSLATRISLLTVAVAVITVVVAGALAFGLSRNAGAGAARANLARVADVAQAVATRDGAATQARLRNALSGLRVRGGVVRPDGVLVTSVPLVRRAVGSDIVRRVSAGAAVSASVEVGDTTVLVEARPTVRGGTVRGGIVLVQRQADATAADRQALRRLLLALVIAGGLAAVIGLLTAWRLARPLRRAAEAAKALAAGDRDIQLPTGGPAEVAAVSTSVNDLARALAVSEDRQRRFLLSVSHDLRTPLTTLTGYAESFADGEVEPGESAEVGAVMLGEARRLDRLVADLLDLARLDAQDFRLDSAPLDLTTFARGASRAWAARTEAAGLVWRAELPDSPLRITTDAERLRQAIDGLLDNAVRLTPPGAVVVLAVRGESDAAVIEVRDGGPGLTPADLAVAFDQGALRDRYRGERAVGTGLGLAIAHRLVTRLGGTVEAGHADEGGARFTLRLPRD